MQGVKVLGAPLGTAEFAAAHGNKVLKEEKVLASMGARRVSERIRSRPSSFLVLCAVLASCASAHHKMECGGGSVQRASTEDGRGGGSCFRLKTLLFKVELDNPAAAELHPYRAAFLIWRDGNVHLLQPSSSLPLSLYLRPSSFCVLLLLF